LDIEANERYLVLKGNHHDVDLFKFRELLDSSQRLQGDLRIATLKQAERVYGGVFMEGYSDEWCEEERRCVRGQYVALLKDLVRASRDARDYVAGADYAQRVIALDPLDEDAHRDLIFLYYLSGNRAAALAQYELVKQELREELGVAPAKATTDLWEYVRSDISSKSRDAWLAKPPQESPDGFVPASPLVGRDAYLNFLRRLLEGAASRTGTAVVICGEIGVGKTRLVDALAAEAGLLGFEVLSGKSPDLKDPAPYYPFIQALWPRLGIIEHLGNRVSSPLISLIDALAPDAVAHHNQPRRNSNLLNNAIITESLLDVLIRPLGSHPTLLVLEDIHRMDRASVDLLATLIGRVAKANILVVATARVGEPRVDQLLSSLAAEGAISLNLERLTEEDSTKLIRASLRSKSVSSTLTHYLWNQTAGNPFFILEFLKLLCAEGTLTKDALGRWLFRDEVVWTKTPKLPLRVQEVVRRRIDMLEVSARKILVLAALIGIDVDFGLLRRLAGLSNKALIKGTESLLHEHLIEEIPYGFRFSHECIRAVALGLSSEAGKQLLHSRIALLMEQVSPRRTEDLAWHFEEARRPEKVLIYSEASGDKARLVHANDDAVHWYSHALTTLDELRVDDQPELLRVRYRLLDKRQEVLDVLGDRSRQLEDIDSIYRIGTNLGSIEIQARALALRGTLFVRLNIADKAIEAATRARSLFSSVNDLSGEARSYLTIGLALLGLRSYRQAYDRLHKACDLFGRARNIIEVANAQVYQGIVLTCLSKYNKAAQSLDDAEQICGTDELRITAYAQMQRGVIFRLLGRAESSRSLMLTGIKALRHIGDRVGEARALIQLALTDMSLGRFREAVYNSRRALRLARQTKDMRAQINILVCLGMGIYRCIGDFSRAKQCLNESMNLITLSSDQENIAMYQDGMAAILLDEGNVREALGWSRLSLESYESTEMGMGQLAEIQYRLGCAYLDLGDWFGAIDYLRSALSIHRRYGEVPFQIRTMVALSRACLMGDDTEKALTFSRRAVRLLRSVEGIDQEPSVFWQHLKVLRTVGAQLQARKYLHRVKMSLRQQASTLRGRMRIRFLMKIRDHSEILEAIRESGDLESLEKSCFSERPSRAHQLVQA